MELKWGGGFDFSALNSATAAVSGTATPASNTNKLRALADFSAVYILPRLVIVSPLTASDSSSALSLFVWLNTSSSPNAEPTDGRSIYLHKYGTAGAASCTADSLMNHNVSFSFSGHRGNPYYYDNVTIRSNVLYCTCAEKTAGYAKFLGGTTYSYLVIGG